MHIRYKLRLSRQVFNSTPFLVGVHIPFVFTWCVDAFDNLVYCI